MRPYRETLLGAVLVAVILLAGGAANALNFGTVTPTATSSGSTTTSDFALTPFERLRASFPPDIAEQQAEQVALETTFTFRRLGGLQYDMLVNGVQFRRIDFRENPLAEFDISQRSLADAGVTDSIFARANRDLQNNVFGTSTGLRVSLSRGFIEGSFNNPPRVPRAAFDFQRVRENKFQLYVNGHKSLYIDLSEKERDNIFISKVSLRRFGVTDESMMRLLDREFGNTQSMTEEGFTIDLSRDRAKSTGDTQFFFEQQSPNGFRLFVNGRKGFWLDLRKYEGDPVFNISKTHLATRFGLTGSVADILATIEQEGVTIERISKNQFQFTVDRDLFLNGGTRNVEDSVFIVRRKNASVS